MKAIITGDIIDSESHKTSKWLTILKEYLYSIGKSPTDWEIYRGDEFQLRVSPAQALEVAIHIKALIKKIKDLDVRIAIGIGAETYIGDSVSESNGPAYQRSGRTFEALKEQKLNMSVATGNDSCDHTLNLMIKLASDFMDDWSTVSAEIVAMALEHPDASQKEIARQLDIRQSAVSQRYKRARLHLVMELLAYYELKIKDIIS